jgi:hypothetical protein
VDRLVLTKTVRHEGRDFWGRYSCLTLEPAENVTDDWLWHIRGRGDVPITPDLMVSLPRRVALEFEGHCLNEFEHIGILRAAGLRGVRLSVEPRGWPPYDGGSCALWAAVMPKPHTRRESTLHPYRPDTTVRHALPQDSGRVVSYSDEGNDSDVLHMSGIIDYAGLGEHRFGHVYPEDDFADLVLAHTLGWPMSLQPFARLAGALGWPHYWRILWPQDYTKARVLEETGRHRMLDMLAILNFAAPADSYLCGALHTYMGGHANDLGLLKQLAGAKVLAFRPAA